MKNIISLTLCIILILTAFGCDAFAFGSVNQNKDSDSDYVFLSQLGLVTDEFEANYVPTAKITRGEFTAMAVNLINASSFSEDISFSDVTPADKYYNTLKSAVACGLITGINGGTFKPDENISYCDAVVIVLRALGYDSAAKYSGGYPTGYLKKAKDIGLIKNISLSSEHINRKEVLTLFSEAVDCPIYDMVGIKDNNVQFSSESGESLLSKYYGIDRYEGVLRALPTVSLENVTLKNNEMLIDNSVYKFRNSISEDVVGAKIYYYVTREDKSVVAYKKADENEEIIRLNIDNISEFTGNSYVYFDGNREKVARFDASYDIVFNSRPAAMLSDSEFIPSIGTVSLYDHDGNGKYEIIRIESYEAVVVDSVNVRNETVTDKYTGKKYDLSVFDSYYITDSFNNSLTIESLREYDIISMCIPKDTSVAKIFYSNSEVYGKIEGCSDMGGTSKLIIFGEEKTVTPQVALLLDEFPVGTGVAVYYDFLGNIACLRHESDVYRSGYLVAISRGGGLEPTTELKIFSDNGKMEILSTGKNVIANGVRTDSDNLYLCFMDENNKFKPQLVLYAQKDGCLAEIDTADSSGSGLQSVYKCYNNGNAERTLWYSVYSKTFGGKIVPSAGAVYFSIPLDPSSDEDYLIFDTTKFDDRNSYAIDAYTTDAESLTSDIFVMYRTEGGVSNIPVNARGMLVESVTDVCDEKGEYTKKINGMHLGRYTSYFVKDEALLNKISDISDSSKLHTLGYGDVIRFSTDHSGRISEIELLYQYDTDTVFEPTALCAMTTYRKKRVKAYQKSGGILQVTTESLDADRINLGLSSVESVPADLYSIYLCRTERGKKVVVPGNMSDITDYCSENNNYSELFMYDVNSDPNRGIIVVFE